MSLTRFEAKLFKIESQTILHLPKTVSAKFPSRGMGMADGTINGKKFQIPLEPDGKGSHWFKFDEQMSKATKAKVGDTVKLEIEPAKEWHEPKIPADFKKALATSPLSQATWLDTTTIARWDWIRWINATKNPQTREKRIEVSLSKLKSGMKRPCCFNRSACTDPDVSHSGVLLDTTENS